MFTEDKPRAFADSIVTENETLLYQMHDAVVSRRSRLPPVFVRSIHPMQALHPLVKPVRVGILVVDFPDGAAWTGVEVPVLTAEFHLQRGNRVGTQR